MEATSKVKLNNTNSSVIFNVALHLKVYNLSSLAGAESDKGPPAASAGDCCQGATQLERNGAEDEGHLPHAQLLQHGCYQKVSYRGVLGASQGSADCSQGAC